MNFIVIRKNKSFSMSDLTLSRISDGRYYQQN